MPAPRSLVSRAQWVPGRLLWTVAAVAVAWPVAATAADDARRTEIWKQLAPFFSPPAAYVGDFGHYRSPLTREDGSTVQTPAEWEQRRQQLLEKWHALLGPWPAIIDPPQVEVLTSTPRENFVQHAIRFKMTPRHTTNAYLLVPEGTGVRPAAVVVYYEPETAIGLGNPDRDFALQLARRGFVVLSMGMDASLYYPTREAAEIQPLSALAYASANAYHVLAARHDVDPQRVGILGHSYGGKWAMFAACLYDKFACSAWSDGGIVFDETRGNVNYWEPWYLGYEQGRTRERGIPSDDRPRTGLYRRLIESGDDLHELHALHAPRPLLVSGGAEDGPQRWKALNHTVAVNRLLGYENRVAMTNRPTHAPTPESNEQMYLFFEYFLMHGGLETPR